MDRRADPVPSDVKGGESDEELLAAAAPVLLERLSRAVLLLDRDHQLRYVSPAARRLLGYDETEPIGGRCRLTTNGRDCEEACPLTYALEAGSDVVPSFAAVYHAKDGRPVPVDVTILVLRDGEGEMIGAVEILSPRGPRLGFFLQGASPVAAKLRRRVQDLAASSCAVVVAGEEPARRDVALAIHRASGLGDELFRPWPAEAEAGFPWPPGTLYVEAGDGLRPDLPAGRPPGWRLIVGTRRLEQPPELEGERLEVLELPGIGMRTEDLPMMMKAWLADLAGAELQVSAGALSRLCRLALDLGLEGVQDVVAGAAAAADGVLDEEHIPADGVAGRWVEELLRSENPLAAMEACVLRELLDRSGWKMQDVADRLGISRVTLWRKLREHGIERGPQG